jgi:hypothetical protein
MPLRVVFLVLLLGAWPAEAEPLKRLSRDFGLRLVDGGGKEVWTRQEAERLLSFFERLPRSLRELPRKTAPRYVNVYKNATGEPFVGEHATLPLLAWQLVVRADSERLERAPTLASTWGSCRGGPTTRTCAPMPRRKAWRAPKRTS